MALAWLLKQDIAVIPKSESKTRMLENLEAADLIEKLTPKHMEELHQVAHEWDNSMVLNQTANDAKLHGENLPWSLSQASLKFK